MPAPDLLQAADRSLFHLVNGLAGQSRDADAFVRLIAGNAMTKGLPGMLLFWALWFAESRLGRAARARLAALLVVSMAAIALGRALAVLLPFRARPIHTPGLGAALPLGQAESVLESWSSFPSDHAVLFFSLAAGFWLVHRLAGILATAHAVLVVSLPRLYLGLHFPSDIVAGAVVGVLVAVVTIPPLARAAERHALVERALAAPHLAYPLMFFVTVQTAFMWEPLRQFLTAAGRLAMAVVS